MVDMAALDGEERPWGAAKTASFRWFVIVSCLFIAPLEPLTNLVIPWIGNHLLGFEGEIEVHMTGSGDSAAEYVRLFLHVVLGILGAALWTALGKRRTRYSTLLHWFTFGLRLAVAIAMLTYGASKLAEGQFSPPGDMRLFQSYGSSSPMGLLWTFMGHSPAYTIFAGVAEIAGGLLLLSRRTTTLGALVVVGVMANVVMLNFCYDVPVKLFSTRLLVWACFVAALDHRRLFAMFANVGSTQPRMLPHLYRRQKARVAGQVAKALLAAFLLLGSIIAPIMMRAENDANTKAIQGTYAVTVYQHDGVDVPPLVTDADRWHRVVIETYDRFVIFSTDGTRSFRIPTLDEEAGTLTLVDRRDEAEETHVFTLTIGDDGALDLRNDERHIVLEVYEPEFLLRDRGFHWVQERPFNR
jgi:uncharacterized membrane protein YphA (DoxX/SURF4 family)